MRIFSGIQPTGDKHARQPHRRLHAVRAHPGARRGLLLHRRPALDHASSTTPRTSTSATLDLAAMLFATGLDPERSTVFAQSHVQAHAEAAWLLGSVTSYGQLGRMTQFKDKSDRQRVRLGRPLHVPGADGRRHPALPDRHRPDRRRPAPAPRARPRRRRALQRALRRDVRRTEGRLPGGRRADHGPAGADEEDVDDGGTRRGPCGCSTSRT